MTTFYFHAVSNKIHALEAAHIALLTALLVLSAVAIPESPQFLHATEQYKESKEALEQVASINGVARYNSKNFIFEAEETIELDENRPPSTNRSGKVDPMNQYGISQEQFITNTAVLTALFSCFSFCFWLSTF